jgi:hypothetical protein
MELYLVQIVHRLEVYVTHCITFSSYVILETDYN